MVEIYIYDRTLQKQLKRLDGLEGDTDPIKKWYLHLKTDKTPKEKT